MRLKTIHVAMILLAALFFAACNAVDSKVNTNNSNASNTAADQATMHAADGARRITTSELETLIKEGKAYVVDVRSQDAYDMGHIPGSHLIPANDILSYVKELPRDKTIVTYCS